MSKACIAWWYLVSSKRHAFVAIFVHEKRADFSINYAESSLSMVGNRFPKDDFITKPNWTFSSGTQRHTLGKVLKYADAIVQSRKRDGYEVEHSSYHEDTGTQNDTMMTMWEQQHAGYGKHNTSNPSWWPTRLNSGWSAPNPNREGLKAEGFDIMQLIAGAKEKARNRRKKTDNGKIIRRIGRFRTYEKDDARS